MRSSCDSGWKSCTNWYSKPHKKSTLGYSMKTKLCVRLVFLFANFIKDVQCVPLLSPQISPALIVSKSYLTNCSYFGTIIVVCLSWEGRSHTCDHRRSTASPLSSASNQSRRMWCHKCKSFSHSNTSIVFNATHSRLSKISGPLPLTTSGSACSGQYLPTCLFRCSSFLH